MLALPTPHAQVQFVGSVLWVVLTPWELAQPGAEGLEMKAPGSDPETNVSLCSALGGLILQCLLVEYELRYPREAVILVSTSPPPGTVGFPPLPSYFPSTSRGVLGSPLKETSGTRDLVFGSAFRKPRQRVS